MIEWRKPYIDEIFDQIEKHGEIPKKEINNKHINLIIKNDKIVDKLIYVLHKGDIYPISIAAQGAAVHHTKNPEIVNTNI